MNEQQKRDYLEKYNEVKKKGVSFFPDIVFKDAVISLAVFLILVALAYFLGAPLEERANPADTSYTPRPEWYFLFLFQLLKYFPGKLEVIGVFILPTLAILILIGLPYLDRSQRRHPLGRPVFVGGTALVVAGIIFLTVQAVREAPPPAEAAGGDPIALLYTKNCSPCHGSSIAVAPGTNLHEVIAKGKHEGMPAWNADLTSDEIDALAGFILSPGGSKLFTEYCGTCHQISDLVASNPLELKNALEQGQNYPPHSGEKIPDWNQALNQQAMSSLLNFLAAPDGQRLFAINCKDCHGSSISYSGTATELKTVITQGGLHLDMPSWREKLSDAELDILAKYVVAPNGDSEGERLFQAHCVECHGKRIPKAADVTQAKQAIAAGGAHQTMPVWGNVLTAEQIDALVNYTLEASRGTPLEKGQELFAKYCSVCHGSFGEGGPNPSRTNDIITPISSAEFLKTRDDFTLRSIITQGQPDSGMSPFGTANGGPLEEEDIDVIVAYMRSWEAKPPVEQPPEVPVQVVSLEGAQVYADICAQCHGPKGEGGVAPAINGSKYQDSKTDQDIFNSINQGHPATSMIGWGGVLTIEQIQQLVKFIRTLRVEERVEEVPAPSGPPTFAKDVEPIFQAKCKVCHGTMGGWDGATYQAAMSSGTHAPVVIPGDVQGSLLAQKLLGTHKEGTIMPPSGKLPEGDIKTILDWIAGGAKEK